VYFQALAFTQRTTKEDGIDAALAMGPGGTQLDALLVPPDVGQTYQVAAPAGYPMITLPAGVHSSTGMPFGLALVSDELFLHESVTMCVFTDNNVDADCVCGTKVGQVGERY